MNMIKEAATKPSLFQWIRGDRMGQIIKSTGETLIDDNIEYIIFEDGSQCNSQLVGEWIVPIDSPAHAPYMQEPVVKPFTPPATADTTVTRVAKSVPPTNPVFDLLDRSKKKTVKLQIEVQVSMPSDELIKVVTDSYDNGAEHIGQYLVASVNQDGLMKQVEAVLRKKVEEVTKKKKRSNEATA